MTDFANWLPSRERETPRRWAQPPVALSPQGHGPTDPDHAFGEGSGRPADPHRDSSPSGSPYWAPAPACSTRGWLAMANIPAAVRSAPAPRVIPPASVRPWFSLARPVGNKAAPVTNEAPPKLAPRT